MGSFGPLEIILVFLVILLIFGAKRIPEIARGMGRGIREFKDATNDIKRELTVDDHQGRIQPPQQGTTAPRGHYGAESPQPARTDKPDSAAEPTGQQS